MVRLVHVGVSEVVVGIGLGVAVREQERRVNHQKGEGEMERDDTHATNTFLQALEPCVYVHTDELVRSTREQNVHVLCAEKCACDR